VTIDAERRGQLRSALGWLASAVILVLAFSLSPNFEWSDHPRSAPYAGDFLHEYAGGWIVREGDRSRLHDPSYFSVTQHDPALTGFTWNADKVLLPLYPTFYYLWVSPLSWLDYRSAAHLFTALSVAALFASVVLIAGFDPASRTWPGLGWWVAASLFYSPVLESLVSGQKGTLLLLIFAGTYRLLAQRALFSAGALFACAAWKPQLLLAVALVMLAKREWRFFAGLAATGAVLCAQSLAVGWETSLDWIATTLHPLPHRELVGRSHNWLGFARLLLGDYSGPAVYGLTLALVGVTLITLFRLLPGPLAFEWPRFRIQFAAIVLATTLVSPHLYTYDLTILVLPLIVLAAELPTLASTGTRRLWLGALLLAFLMGAVSTSIAARVPLQCSALASFALLLALNRHPTLSREVSSSAGAIVK
jgi:hypothetical protein